MERGTDDGEGSPRIDVRTLPESVAALWETMLRLDPSWDLAKWLDERAKDELGLVESHLGREKLRVEQRLVFGSGSGVTKTDELEVEFEGEQAAVDFGSMDVGDDPLLAIVSEHVLGILEVARLAGLAPVHFDSLVSELVPLGIRVDDLDEAIAWLLQSEAIIEIDEDAFALSE